MENTILRAKDILGQMTSGSGSKLPVGIHNDVKVTDIEVGVNWIDFNFEKDNLVHNKRVWFPDPNKVYPKEGESLEDAKSRDVNERLAHIVKFMDIFLGKEVVDSFAAPNFKSFAEKAAAMLNDSIGNNTVNIKLIYDKDGVFSTFPTFPNYIEKHVPGQEPTIKFSNWELEHRCNPKSTGSSDIVEGTQALDNLI